MVDGECLVMITRIAMKDDENVVVDGHGMKKMGKHFDLSFVFFSPLCRFLRRKEAR